MTNEQREQVALFRYGLIAPLLSGQFSQGEYLAEICSKVHDVPYYGKKEFAPKTVEGWLRAYRKQGFAALKPKGRSDQGACRVLTPEDKEQILKWREKHRLLSAMLFYEQLVKDGIISPQKVSYHTVYRILKAENLLERDPGKFRERKRFAYDKVNILWQGDMSVGPYLVIGGKKLRTNLFAFLDDCSRLVPYAQFSFSEKFDSLKEVLKEALLRRGIPKMIYVDNGKVYQAQPLQMACASLGITLTHTQPYDPESKGKIERFFGTVRRRFYPLLAQDPPTSLEELNRRFLKWLEEDYHRKIHSATGMCPLDLFMSQASSLRLVTDPNALEPLFFKRDYRKVKPDGTISVLNQLFEVPLQYAGERIEIRYDPSSPQAVYVYEQDHLLWTAKPVSFSDNAHLKRGNSKDASIATSFEAVFSGGQEVQG